MRAAQALPHLTAQISERFDADVAAAILADADPIESAASRLCGDATADAVTDAVKDIAANVDDRLADWLAERAESPGAWLYSQLRDSL